MRSSLIVCFITLAIIAGITRFKGSEQDDSQDEGSRRFRPITVIDGGLPAITDVDTVALDEADQVIEDNELVIGVEYKGVAIAYPINMLTGPSREIINTEIEGTAIAATW